MGSCLAVVWGPKDDVEGGGLGDVLGDCFALFLPLPLPLRGLLKTDAKSAAGLVVLG